MIDLKGALLAAAEEAGKIQEELKTQRTRMDILTSNVDYLMRENDELKTKLRDAGTLMRQFADIIDPRY